VVFGEPYTVRPQPGVPLKLALQAAAEEMAKRVAELLPESYRGVYAGLQGLGAVEIAQGFGTFEKTSP
jgi:hypothetical protein